MKGGRTRPKPPTDRREGDTYEVIFRDETGAQRQKTLTARGVQRAIAEADEYRTQIRRGEMLPPSGLTFEKVAAEYFELFESLVATGVRSSRTLDLYRNRFDRHIAPLIGRRRIQEVRAEHIGSIFGRQRKMGLAEWTISGTMVVISSIFSFALSRGYVTANPLDRLSKFERPKQVSTRESRRLSDEEVRRLCAAATLRYRPIVTTLAWTGLRVSEALGLRWTDIDFEAGEIRVRHQLCDDGTLKRPKTKAGIRSVPLLPVLAHTLREHRKEQLALGIAGPEHFVFTTASGKPLDRHNVRNQGIKIAAKEAGLIHDDTATVTTHDLRRTFISHLILRLGLDPVRVAKIVGHTNVSVTLNTYADEFDKAMHREDLLARIERAGFGCI